MEGLKILHRVEFISASTLILLGLGMYHPMHTNADALMARWNIEQNQNYNQDMLAINHDRYEEWEHSGDRAGSNDPTSPFYYNPNDVKYLQKHDPKWLNNELNGTNTENYKSDIKDDVNGTVSNSYAEGSMDDYYPDSCPDWLRGYWSAESHDTDMNYGTEDTNEDGYADQDDGDGANDYIFLDTAVNEAIGIHRINHHKIYCYTKDGSYTGYWDRISKSTFDNDTSAAPNNSSDGDYVTQYGKDVINRYCGRQNHSLYFYSQVGNKLLDISADATTNPTTGVREATPKTLNDAKWLANHNVAPVLKDIYSGLYDTDPTINRAIRQQSPKIKRPVRKHIYKRHQHVQKIRSYYAKHRRRNTYRKSHKAILSHVAKFKRSSNKYQLKRSGFKALNKVFGSKFIFNKYAPTDTRAVIPKHFNLRHLGWIQGKFGAPKHKLIFYRQTKHGWIKMK